MNNIKPIKIDFDSWESCGNYFLIHTYNWDNHTTDFYCCIYLPRDFPLDLFYEFLESGFFYILPTVKYVTLSDKRFLVYDFIPFD